MRTWTDESTGRTVRQLTAEPDGCGVGYFREPRWLPGGWFLARRSTVCAVHPDTGEVRRIEHFFGSPIWLRESDGRCWYMGPDSSSIYSAVLPEGQPELVAQLPPGAGLREMTMTCDCHTLVIAERRDEQADAHDPSSPDPREFWAYFDRPRSGTISTCDLARGALRQIHRSDRFCLAHIEGSAVDPTLVRFAPDCYEAEGQRIWTIRTDGSDLRPIRPQEPGEFITHEFWWPDNQHIGYKYQDRRNDPTLRDKPSGEFAPVPLQFGLATLEGDECYLSDPLNHYHSHIFASRDGRLLCGEGTQGHSFVYAARFDRRSTKVEFVPLATVHTPYHVFSGAQKVGAQFTPDGRWLIYNDTLDGKWQVCAVEVDF